MAHLDKLHVGYLVLGMQEAGGGAAEIVELGVLGEHYMVTSEVVPLVDLVTVNVFDFLLQNLEESFPSNDQLIGGVVVPAGDVFEVGLYLEEVLFEVLLDLEGLLIRPLRQFRY